MMKNKRGLSGLEWFLIILILIAIGVGIYFWLSGGSVPSPPSLPGSEGVSGSILTPPALPPG